MAYTTIDDPSAYFQTKIYTGNATDDTAYTNDGNSNLQPDLIWAKNRDQTVDHVWFDSTRGATKNVRSNTNASESTNSNYLKSFNSDGFTMGTSNRVNGNTDQMVAWQWKANGGTTASNSDGSITSTVQANTTAGFSIQTFTSASSGNSNWGHGLGSTPDFFMVKRRDGTSSWWLNQTGMTRSGSNWHYMPLDSTSAQASLSAFNANSTTITSSNDFIPNSASTICYAFKSIQGYSKFGSYTGNANADGPFVYTGFKPAWIIQKNTANSTNWNIYDNKRSTFNKADDVLLANANIAEEAVGGKSIDFLSNGFKLRGSDNETNDNGDVHIYMAFAESPFVSSEGVPTTAR